MALFDYLLVISLSVCVGLLGEGLSWFFVYRHEGYKELCGKVERIQGTLDELKNKVVAINKRKGVDRKREAAEKDLQRLSTMLQRKRMWSQLGSVVLFIGIYQYIGSVYAGESLAILPFEPIGFIRGISHRGLDGEDWTQASFAFVYMLAGMGLRPIVQKLIGNEGPKVSMWQQQWDKMNREQEAE